MVTLLRWLLNQSQVSSRWVITACARIAYCCSNLEHKYLHIPLQFITPALTNCHLSHLHWVGIAFLTGEYDYILIWLENCVVLKIVNLSFTQPLGSPLYENNSINRDPFTPTTPSIAWRESGSFHFNTGVSDGGCAVWNQDQNATIPLLSINGRGQYETLHKLRLLLSCQWTS